MMGYKDLDSDSGCKTHPNLNQHQLPGVCPSCLRDRLLSTLSNYSSFHEQEFRDSSAARISDPFPGMEAFSRSLNGSSDVFHLRQGISKSVRLTNVDVDGKSKYLGFNLNKSRSAAAASSTTRPYSYRGSGSNRRRHGKGDGHDLYALEMCCYIDVDLDIGPPSPLSTRIDEAVSLYPVS